MTTPSPARPTTHPAPMPLVLRVFVALVALDLVVRACFIPADITAQLAVGARLLVVVGLLRRSEVARLAALVLATFAVLVHLPRIVVLPLFAASEYATDAAVTALVDTVMIFTLGAFVLVTFSRPDVTRFTTSAPRPESSNPNTP